MILKPLRDEILVKDVPDRLVSTGGISLSRAWEHPSGEAIVRALGPKSQVELKIGTRLLTRPYAGREIEFQGEKLRLLKPSDIIGIASSESRPEALS